jgi:hypothetical protein
MGWARGQAEGLLEFRFIPVEVITTDELAAYEQRWKAWADSEAGG